MPQFILFLVVHVLMHMENLALPLEEVEKGKGPKTIEEWEAYCSAQEEYVEGCVEFTVSLVYTANTTCTEQAPADSGFWWPEQTLRKPVGKCTKNVIGNTVIFECDPSKGVIMEHVYHDVLDGSVCKGPQCTCESDIVYTLPIENGCSEQFFGGMHMVWDNFCQAPAASVASKQIDYSPTPFTLCKSSFFDCDGVYDGTGRCVCGSEVRTVRFIGTFKDKDCTIEREKLPQFPIAMDACFHLPFGDKMYSIKVSCLKDRIGANFRMWDGLDCNSDNVAEATVYPDTCVFGGLETYVRGDDTWVIDDTCSDDPISINGPATKRPTIAGAAVATDNLSTLVAAVKAGNLVDTLDGAGSFTVFAPDNDAFAKVPENALSDLLKPENADKLKGVLLRHVLPSISLAKAIPEGTTEVKTVGGEMVKITKSSSGVTIESSAGKANVIATDVLTSNGVVHVVDSVF